MTEASFHNGKQRRRTDCVALDRGKKKELREDNNERSITGRFFLNFEIKRWHGNGTSRNAFSITSRKKYSKKGKKNRNENKKF